ncbi:MAG: transcription termination/antitermination NusG family protein [Verrucomicrobiota bacterium]
MNADFSVWYCARTKPKQEHMAALNIRGNLGLEVFLPRIQIKRVTRRGKVRFVEPLFPGYIFIYTPLNSKFEEIRRTSGVSTLIHFGDIVPTVPAAAIDELKKSFGRDEPVPVEDDVRPGAEVSIGTGAFRSLNGVVLKGLPGKQRVQVLLEILGRLTVVELDDDSIVREKRSISVLLPEIAA